ncbi:hypothetical protein GCM10022276_23030 [Sphingomonas limnosediminicola]|uniref:Methanethiol oxidase n=1 Tax=Sphingomonas limnosediminicola TaxID=940133 RepID=A0ABP7LKM8_9SPHN
MFSRCRMGLLALLILVASVSPLGRAGVASVLGPSAFLLAFVGDTDEADQDFLATLDLRRGSTTLGKVIATTPIGTKGSMPHHMEYWLPPSGRLLFANSHHHEDILLLDIHDPLHVAIEKRIRPPAPLRFPHDFYRLPNGNVLVGFLRSEGPSPRAGDKTFPGGPGGIAEYDASGRLLRRASAAADTREPVRVYALTMLPKIDRIVTTSAAMMEESAADVVQVWRYSDFKLLHTIPVPPGVNRDGSVALTAAHAPFALRALANGNVLVSTYGCGLNLLTGVTSSTPQIRNVYTFDADEPKGPGEYRGACAVPLILRDKLWLMPVGGRSTLVTLDISDLSHPRERSRLLLPHGFAPHWLARDPASDRLVLCAHNGGQQGFFILKIDERTGHTSFDDSVHVAGSSAGYIDLTSQRWPHGRTGPGWAHSALFLPAEYKPETASLR